MQRRGGWIDDIVGVFVDPIIVFPGGWGDTLPEWLKAAIISERLVETARTLKDEPPTASDAEACAYLHTAALTQPMGGDWTEIFLYIAGKVYEAHRSKVSGITMPDDIKVKCLSDYRAGLLRQLKGWIYERRVRIRQERSRAERRQQRDEHRTEAKELRPALFEF